MNTHEHCTTGLAVHCLWPDISRSGQS
eukprot:SAG22_NODE_16292_length_329_cov_0.543478_1_plen_26_part_10